MELVVLIKDIAKHLITFYPLPFNILYLDMNNLYGCAMRQYLPINNFKWVKNILKIEKQLMNIKNYSSTGYVLEVDLEYP